MFSGSFGLNLNYRYGSVAGFVDNTMKFGEDKTYMVRDLGIDLNRGVYFKSNFHQVSTVVMWDISNTVWGLNRLLNPQSKNKPYKIRKVGFYGYAGLGMIWYNSELKHLDTKLDVQATDLASNDKYLLNPSNKTVTEWTIPVGMGLKFKCSKLIDVKIEGNGSFIFTDKLDKVIYDHPNRWKNDVISAVSVGLTFKLGGKKNDRESINWINGLEYFNARFDKIEKKIDRVLTDNDKDGVSDVFDKETETPEGTMVDGSGKSMDIDRDGIVDTKDLEIFSPDATKVDEFGKTKDDDADGVVNGEDKEPNSARGARVDWQGVTIPVITPEKPKAPIDNLVLTSIFFDYNKSNIKQEYYKELFKVVNFAKQNPNTKITIQGNADVRGEDDYNIKLGQSRAEAIIAYFTKYFNISSSQFIIESKGEREPISKENDLNRRVDFVVTQ
jgi:outer membrane protein OmpA-like peptidoglycan-associated protein